MGVLRDGAGWCFCSGGVRSERIKGSIFSTKSPAIASISSPGGECTGAGFLVHRDLLLTTHANVPSAPAAEAAEIRLHCGRVPAHLDPHRFFITSPVLDLSIVGLDNLEVECAPQGQQLRYLKTTCNPIMNLGSAVYLLGNTGDDGLMVGEGKVVIATDNLIKFATEGVTWCPGSAGFDSQGNLAFMVCDPMKLASSLAAKSSSVSSTSSTSWKKDVPMQFGIPIPIILDWLYQHWEGSLDEPSKPKLPLIHLMSTGQRSENSCTSFTMRQVFKQTDGEGDDMPSSSQILSKHRSQLASSCLEDLSQNEIQHENLHDIHDQGIPTPEIYESPKLTSGPLRKKDNTPIQLLDINFPPRPPRSIVLPLPLRQLLPDSDKEPIRETKPMESLGNECIGAHMVQLNSEADNEAVLTNSDQGDCHSEVQSTSSPLEDFDPRHDDGLTSGEETMYSAETMESRNCPNPKENGRRPVGRSQSCMNYSRWTSSHRTSTMAKGSLKMQCSLVPARRTNSQTGGTPQRSHEYFSPTVSSSMKKRNNINLLMRPRQNVIPGSPRWVV